MKRLLGGYFLPKEVYKQYSLKNIIDSTCFCFHVFLGVFLGVSGISLLNNIIHSPSYMSDLSTMRLLFQF
jgi:hypothetical protein